MTTGQTVLYSLKYFRTMVRFKNFFSEMTSTLTNISQRKVEIVILERVKVIRFN